MTNTEQRLTDALHTVARSVHEETLPPPEVPAPNPRRRWLIRLTPAFAAAGVALAVALSLLAGHSGPPAPPAVTGAPPAHYVVQTPGELQIRSTATGTLTGVVHTPAAWSYPGPVAAAPDGTTFYAAFAAGGGSAGSQFELYSFQITGSGHVTAFAPVKNGTFDDAEATALSVSPDGSRIALTMARPVRGATDDFKPAIEIINPATGARQQWSGGLERAGLYPYLLSIGWQGTSGPLVFLAQWCASGVNFGVCGVRPAAAQVRTLVLTGGGSLAHGSVLFSSSASYPYLAQALVTDHGSSLILLEQTGWSLKTGVTSFRLLRVPFGQSGPSRVLFQGKLAGHGACVQSDASGHLIIDALRSGWLDHGRLRPLPPQGGVSSCSAW